MDKLFPNWTLILQFIMFVTAMIVLSKFLFKPMLAVFEKRRTATIGPREEAAKLKQDAETAKQQVDMDIRAAREQVHKLREALLEKATTEERNVVGEARAKAQAQIAHSREHLNQSIATAKQKLAVQAEELSEQLASSLLNV